MRALRRGAIRRAGLPEAPAAVAAGLAAGPASGRAIVDGGGVAGVEGREARGDAGELLADGAPAVDGLLGLRGVGLRLARPGRHPTCVPPSYG